MSFTFCYDFGIINSPDRAATFDNHEGQIRIDLLLVRKCAHRINDWTIHDCGS